MLRAYRQDGWAGLWARASDALGDHRPIGQFYDDWIKLYDTPSEAVSRRMKVDLAKWSTVPLITVLMPLNQGDVAQTLAAINSCRAQLYPRWELLVCLGGLQSPSLRKMLLAIAQRDVDRIRVVDADPDDGVCAILNNALADAAGEHFVLLENSATLSEYALFWVAREITQHPTVDLIFSDEDRLSDDGQRCDVKFKSDWNPALMLSCNAFGHLGAYRKSLVGKVGGFCPGFAESFEYDLVLRCARATTPNQIRHIPLVLYHSRYQTQAASAGADIASEVSNAAWETGRKTIEQHLHHTGVNATVRRNGVSDYQVEYALPAEPTHVSILVPSRCEPRLLEPCLRTLLTRTTYAHFDVLLIVNERHRPAAERIEALTQFANSSRVRVLTYADRPFNYSWVNNWAARQASGKLLCFLNDDTILTTPDWLERLIARASQPGVAAAGPMLRYPDDTIQQAGVILGLGGIAGHACHGLSKGSGGYLNRAGLEQDVSCLTAACLVMRKSAFQDVNGFDEALPIAYNDVDLCLRLRQAGWRLIWTPTVELYHSESSSVGRHDAPERMSEFNAAVALMRKRWGDILDTDPYYNPNLSLRTAYHLAFPPRISPI